MAARSGSPAARSIHDDEAEEEEEEAESNPKRRQMREGKAMEKKERLWSEACLRRNESTAEQAAAIWGSEEAARMVAERSWARLWASMERGIMAGAF